MQKVVLVPTARLAGSRQCKLGPDSIFTHLASTGEMLAPSKIHKHGTTAAQLITDSHLQAKRVSSPADELWPTWEHGQQDHDGRNDDGSGQALLGLAGWRHRVLQHAIRDV